MNRTLLYKLAFEGFACGVLLMSAIRHFNSNDFSYRFYLDILFFLYFICAIIYNIHFNEKKIGK